MVTGRREEALQASRAVRACGQRADKPRGMLCVFGARLKFSAGPIRIAVAAKVSPPFKRG